MFCVSSSKQVWQLQACAGCWGPLFFPPQPEGFALPLPHRSWQTSSYRLREWYRVSPQTPPSLLGLTPLTLRTHSTVESLLRLYKLQRSELLLPTVVNKLQAIQKRSERPLCKASDSIRIKPPQSPKLSTLNSSAKQTKVGKRLSSVLVPAPSDIENPRHCPT